MISILPSTTLIYLKFQEEICDYGKRNTTLAISLSTTNTIDVRSLAWKLSQAPDFILLSGGIMHLSPVLARTKESSRPSASRRIT